MSLRIVLLTRLGRPSGAQMAWRLAQAGMSPSAIIVEERSKMVGKRKNPFELIRDFGGGFLLKRVFEALAIKLHFYARKFSGRRFKSQIYLSIEEWTLDHPEVRIYKVSTHNSPECQKFLQGLRPDIGILTNTRRIKKEILQIPRHGFLNLHLSALPQYAGLDSIFWALDHGEKEIGVTVHFAAEEIDRGDIVLQRKIPVSRFDNEDSLYQKALWLGTFLVTEAVKKLEAGTLEKIPQEPGKGSYFSWPTGEQRKEFRKKFKAAQEQAFHSSERPKNIHLITRMTRGGAQKNTLATVEGLKKKGYEVTLITGSSWGSEGEILSEALDKGLEVVLIPEMEREIRPLKDLWVGHKLKSWLAKNTYVIFHTHTSKAGFLGRWAASRAKTLAVIHTPHGHVFHSYFSFLKERFFLILEQMAAKASDRLIALTDRCRKEHLDLKVGKPAQWVTIPSGVDEKKFEQAVIASPPNFLAGAAISGSEIASASFGSSPRNDRRIIGFIGRLAPVKGAKFLIEAMPQILQSIPNAYCVLVGDGEEKQALQKRILELRIEKSVFLAGHQKEITPWLSAFEVLVVPSLNEGMGRVIVEGGFLAKPVIGTEVGGITDLIENEKTGLLVKPRASSEIAQAVIRLLQDPAFASRLGTGLQVKALSGFTENHMIEKIHALYQEVLAQKGIEAPAQASTAELEKQLI